jgi:exo-beta-1,3-glucanase (GH17 family)
MVAKGDSATPLWLTEVGWSTSTGAQNGVSESVQADRLKKAFDKIDDYPYVGPSFWYNFRNNYWSHNNPNDIEAGYGLTHVDFSPKPSYTAFKNL